ncbi:MAG: hypothetical protein KFH98_06760 [Gemmatimonadetes bacterium]|nr:hypothetical protein [Gemmatimonadota bacterium]
MSHLSLETIARLVEDEPDAAEAAHLSACAECRSQLDAMTEDVHALAMLPDMAAAPDGWNALERRLLDEGLIRTRAQRFGGVRMMQIAAALLLFVGGTLAGRMTAQTPAVMTAASDAANPAANPVMDGPAGAVADRSPSGIVGGANDVPAMPAVPQGSLAAVTDPAPAAVSEQSGPRRSVTLAGDGGARMHQPATLEEAAQYVRAREAEYLAALTGFAELASGAGAGDPVARLAALQSIILTTQAALNETPTDPVINGYHLTALAQRDATLRQVAQASSPQWY